MNNHLYDQSVYFTITKPLVDIFSEVN